MAEREDGPGPGNITITFIAHATLAMVGVFALAYLLWLGRDIVFIAFFALVVASFFSIFIEPLARRGMSRALAGPLILVGLLALLIGLGYLGWPTLRDQLGLVQSRIPATIASVQAWWDAQTRGLTGALGDTGAYVEQQLRQRVSNDLASIVAGTLPLLNTVVGAITGLVLVTVAGLFIAISPHTYMRGVVMLVPRTRRHRAREVLPRAGTALRQWMKGTAIGMLIIGVLTTLGLWLIGVPAALALGVIAGFLEFIPYVGPALSFVPAIAVALAISPGKALWAIGLYGLIQFAESNLVMPLLMKGMVKLPPALTILFQALMAVLFGFLGILLAVPILAVGKVLVEELYVEAVADSH